MTTPTPQPQPERTAEIKRYEGTVETHDGVPYATHEEEPEGYWVKFDDHEALITTEHTARQQAERERDEEKAARSATLLNLASVASAYGSATKRATTAEDRERRLREALESIAAEHHAEGRFCYMCAANGGTYPCATALEANAALSTPAPNPQESARTANDKAEEAQ